MKTRLVLVVTLTVTLLLVAVIPALAGQPDVDSYWLEYSAGGTACTGDWVEFRGQMHFVTLTQSDEQGTHYFEHLNASVVGLGMDSGTTYQLVMVGNENGHADSDGAPDTTTSTYQWRLVGPGPDNNDMYQTTAHITYNANGIVTVEFDESRFTCS
jgi:hypothetical protein